MTSFIGLLTIQQTSLQSDCMSRIQIND